MKRFFIVKQKCNNSESFPESFLASTEFGAMQSSHRASDFTDAWTCISCINLKKNNKYYLNHSQCIGVIVIPWYVTCTKRLHLSPTPSIHLAPTTGRRCHQNGPQCWHQPAQLELCAKQTAVVPPCQSFIIVWYRLAIIWSAGSNSHHYFSNCRSARARTHTTVPHIVLV